jgi:hypothetical protein
MNTKAVGYAGIALAIVTALASNDIRNAIVSVVTAPTPANVSTAVGVIAAFVLAYLGTAHGAEVPAQAGK